jgi:hypothetical protein
MSLDKWIKDDKEKNRKDNKIEEQQDQQQKQKAQLKPIIKKHILICPKKNCGYQKTLMKKKLSERDKICPRCKGKMKLKKA